MIADHVFSAGRRKKVIRSETARQVEITTVYRQSRVVAPTPEEAARLVEEKYPDLDRITLFPCSVQPWPKTTWWE